jgi:hypothetical protein
LSNHGHPATWDYLGIAASVLCLIHCLALPILALIGMAIPDNDEVFHKFLLIVVCPVAIIAFGYAGRKNGTLFPMILGVSGVIMVLVGSLAHDLLSDVVMHSVTFTGTLFLISGHIMNLRDPCRICKHEGNEDD